MSVEQTTTRARPAVAIEIDESRQPLVVVTIRGVAADAEYERYLADCTRILRRLRSAVTVADLTQAGRASAHQLKRQVEWHRANLDLLKSCSLGAAFVITSPIVRGALSTILWMQPLAQPHLITTTKAEAERWATARLLDAGLRIPSP